MYSGERSFSTRYIFDYTFKSDIFKICIYVILYNYINSV